MNRLLTVFLCASLGAGALRCFAQDALMAEVERQTRTPHLVHAHAHNDYEHVHPLFDALSHGFPSVEADIHLVDGKLLVAHEPKEVDPKKTLQSLYLDPLRERVRRFKGRMYPMGDATFYLLIDTKTETNATYRVLRKVLEQYSDMLTSFGPEGVRQKAITVVLTGNRPRQLLAQERSRLAALDGTLSDLDGPPSGTLFLWVSDNWRDFFQWQGQGPFPDDAKARLKEMVRKAHSRDLKIRFWNAPDISVFWKEMRDDGVDLVNTDDLAGVEKFLRARPDGN
jgi:glycerophosphoryl diester phosphodiesterase